MVVDVFPRTLDEFYAFNWDSALGAQADRDGDGLLAASFNGSDPDDTTADTDGDGLSDRFELTLQSKGINLSRGTPGALVWQRGFYEHIVRDESRLLRIRTYILANPGRWANDPENTPSMNR
jgi:hypothetical protein